MVCVCVSCPGPVNIDQVWDISSPPSKAIDTPFMCGISSESREPFTSSKVSTPSSDLVRLICGWLARAQ